jgi:hypothetical protein
MPLLRTDIRTTDDLDLIVERGQRAKSGKLFFDLGMSIKNDADNFAQFESQSDSSMNVDLMFVSESVFSQLERAAIEKKVDSVSVRVVSLLHLIALKCHAIQKGKSMLRGVEGHGRSSSPNRPQSAGLERNGTSRDNSEAGKPGTL